MKISLHKLFNTYFLGKLSGAIWSQEELNDLTTGKRFSEKPIVAFTNNTAFILDFYICQSLFGLMFWN